MHLVRTIAAHADTRPDRVALTFDGRETTYAALWDRVTRFAEELAASLGVGAGDRLVYIGHNCPEALYLFFACARIGAVFVPINWRLSEREMCAVVRDARPTAIVAGEDFSHTVDSFRSELEPAAFVGLFAGRDGWQAIAEITAEPSARADFPYIEPGAPLLIVYTSGTTGKPKGSVLSHNAVFWTSINSIQAHDFNSTDHVLTDLPLFHVGGLLLQTVPILFAGGCVTLEPRFEPERTLRDIGRMQPTTYLAVPATMTALIGDPLWETTDISCLRQVMAGSAIVPTDLIAAFHDRNVPVGQLYGATEMGIGTCLPSRDAFRLMGSCGKPVTFCDMRVVDDDGGDVTGEAVGEVLIRGPSLMDGYWRNPDATAEVLEDGWYRTGDVGCRDEDGYLYLKARKREVINAGGEKVYPAEIESVLAECAAIAEAAVVGYPDSKWGELPAAFIVRRGDAAIDAAAISKFLEGRLARYKHPRRIVFLDELPRNAMGKVSKQALKTEAAESSAVAN